MSRQRAARWVVRLARPLVPRAWRERWFQEWTAELAGHSGVDDGVLLRHSLGAWPDALWLRQQATWDLDLVQDLRHAVRQLRRAPLVSLTAIATLALAIGANVAVFSVVDGVLLRPLPFPEPDRLAVLWQSDAGRTPPRDQVAPANFYDWREGSTAFEAMAALNPWSLDDLSGDEPVARQAWMVSEGFFDVVGLPLHLGRGFRAEDHAAGADPVVVLSYDHWRTRHGGDPGVLGSALSLSGSSYTVVGVASPDLRLHFGTERPMWIPQVPSEGYRQLRTGTFLQVVGRLKPGVSLAAARAELDAIAARLAVEHPRTNATTGVEVIPLREHIVGRVDDGLLLTFAAVGLVLAIAAANVGSLLLARGSGRGRELAVRAALGASGWRLVRQLAVEGVVLAGAGGLLGVGLAAWGLRALLAAAPIEIPFAERASLDGTALGFALAAAAVVATAASVLPALQTRRLRLAPAVTGGERTTDARSTTRARAALVTVEVGLALLLAIGAGLLVRSFSGLSRVDPGFSPRNVAAFQVYIWGQYDTPEARAAAVAEIVASLRAVPGVRHAGAAMAVPFVASSAEIPVAIEIEGRPAAPGEEPEAVLNVATPGYFDTLGIPLRRGRDFTEADAAGAPPVVIVSQALADRHWAGEDPIGRRVVWGNSQKTSAAVVGVVGDVLHEGLEGVPRPELYAPHAQSRGGGVILTASTSVDVAAQLKALRAAVWRVAPTITFYVDSPLESLVGRSLRDRRFYMEVLAAFAAVAVVLATVGVYGLLSFAFQARAREIALRVTLGASRAHVYGLVLAQAAALAGGGVLLGLATAAGSTRLLSGMLYGVAPTDGATFALAALGVMTLAAAAALGPARRATALDPARVLRE